MTTGCKRRFGYLDRDGKAVTPAIFEAAEPFAGGVARVTQNDKVGFVGQDGKLAVPAIFDEAEDFSEGLARVSVLETGADGLKYLKHGYIRLKR